MELKVTAHQPVHPETRVGAVHLAVRGLDSALDFYRRCLGFAALGEDGRSVLLGAGDSTLLVLVEDPRAPVVHGSPGLYHVAVLLPSRPHLADALRRLARSGTPLQGASDHGVSEALYLADPEGNGIELYCDRPRDAWPRRDGRLTMGTARLDVQGLLAEPETGQHAELPERATVGHVHLRVSDVVASEAFYCDAFGFELMQRYGESASFVSAGGYHHHIAFNTWESRGAPPPPSDAAGLRCVEVQFSGETARARTVARLRSAGAPIAETPGGPLVRDPSGNALVLTVEAS